MKTDSFKVVPMDGVVRKKLEVVRIANESGTQMAVIKTGMSSRTIRHWKRCFKMEGLAGLANKSRAPRRVHNKKDSGNVLKTELIRLHNEEPGLTRIEIKIRMLGCATEETVSVSWISRTRKLLGLTRSRKTKVNSHQKRYEIPTPGFLQIDTKEVPASSLSEPKNKLYQFTAIDECSRVRFLMGTDNKSKITATRFLERTVEFFKNLNVTVVRVQTDNGTEFTLPHNERTMQSYAEGNTEEALFTQKCNDLQIKHRLIKPRTPELNGKVERSHRIDGERFYSRFIFKDYYELDHALQNTWVPEYNQRRPHSAINYQTPMQFLESKIIQIQKGKQIALEKLNPTDLKIAA